MADAMDLTTGQGYGTFADWRIAHGKGRRYYVHLQTRKKVPLDSSRANPFGR
jgi:hypothetical protein